MEFSWHGLIDHLNGSRALSPGSCCHCSLSGLSFAGFVVVPLRLVQVGMRVRPFSSVSRWMERPFSHLRSVTDFCSGGTDNTPESSITNIMSKKGFTEDDLIVRVVLFYIYVSSPCLPLLSICTVMMLMLGSSLFPISNVLPRTGPSVSSRPSRANWYGGGVSTV